MSGKTDIKGYTAIIILNYNNAEWTLKCIESVERYNTAPIKYIVIDNGSDKAEDTARLKSYMNRIFNDSFQIISDCESTTDELKYANLILSPTNDGYARGNNKGLKYAYQDKSITDILILNNDITFVQDVIPGLSKYVVDLPDVGIVSPLVYSKTLDEFDYTCARRKSTIGEEIFFNFCHPFFPSYVERKLEKRRWMLLGTQKVDKILQVDLTSGSCIYMRKELFERIGSFDPNTFLFWEEQILYEKINHLGLRNYLCPDLKCIHWGGATMCSFSGSLFTLKCENESSLYYWKNYADCKKYEYEILKFSMSFYTVLRNIRRRLAPVRQSVINKLGL